MSDVPEVPDDAASEQDGRLLHLNRQVKAMRAVLAQLLQDVVQAETRLDRSQAAQLLEANERLVVTAMAAQADVETANGALDTATRIGGLDPLTALPNRTLLLDRFESAISNAKRHGKRVALLFVDLDSFKQINDDLGHAAGDRALQVVADCLKSLVRESDTVSRHGGDEFLVLLSEVEQRADASLVAGKVNAALSACSSNDEHPFSLTASVGISVYPEDGEDAKTLIDRADAAMYLAKRRGPGGWLFHGHRPADAAFPARASRDVPWHHPTQFELSVMEHDRQNAQLREANEALVLAALGAQELLAAAEHTKARQAELLALVAKELNDPFAPIRIAAGTLGISGAENTLLSRALDVINEQAERVSRMVKEVLDQQGPNGGR